MPAMARIVLLLLGVAAFLAATSAPVAAQTVTVHIGDFWFCNSSFQGGVCATQINLGDTVVWDMTSVGPSVSHTTTECGNTCDFPTGSPDWDSGILGPGPGDSFSFTFNQAGTYLYRCSVHPSLMRGTIIVNAAVGGVAELPNVIDSQRAATEPGGPSWGLLGGAIGGVASVAGAIAGAAWYARRRLLD